MYFGRPSVDIQNWPPHHARRDAAGCGRADAKCKEEGWQRQRAASRHLTRLVPPATMSVGQFASVLWFDKAGALSQASDPSEIFHQWQGTVADRGGRRGGDNGNDGKALK